MLKLIARILARPAVADAIIRRAQRTPYFDIKSADGATTYMGRWWLFNRYDIPEGPRFKWLPSARVHHIMREDIDRHLHDHPWNARTFILRGWYLEERENTLPGVDPYPRYEPAAIRFRRETGHTGRLLFGEFHRIEQVSPGGVWTLFITWRYRGTWGFKVGDRKIPWRDYFNGAR